MGLRGEARPVCRARAATRASRTYRNTHTRRVESGDTVVNGGYPVGCRNPKIAAETVSGGRPHSFDRAVARTTIPCQE